MKFDWKRFKKYVETYDPEKDGMNDTDCIQEDMIYGVGLCSGFRFADGYSKFKQLLVARWGFLRGRRLD